MLFFRRKEVHCINKKKKLFVGKRKETRSKMEDKNELNRRAIKSKKEERKEAKDKKKNK